MDHYIGTGVGEQGYKRNQQGEVDEQRKVSGKRGLPGKLSDAGQSAKALNGDGGTQRQADGDAD